MNGCGRLRGLIYFSSGGFGHAAVFSLHHPRRTKFTARPRLLRNGAGSYPRGTAAPSPEAGWMKKKMYLGAWLWRTTRCEKRRFNWSPTCLECLPNSEDLLLEETNVRPGGWRVVVRNVGPALHLIRIAKRLSQEAVAERLGAILGKRVAKVTFARSRRDIATYRCSRFGAICQALGCKLSEVMDAFELLARDSETSKRRGTARSHKGGLGENRRRDGPALTRMA